MLSFFQNTANRLFDAAVYAVATFTAAVLNSPAVQNAVARAIVLSMKMICHEPDLDEHLQAVSETLSQNVEREAKRAGKDFPRVVGSFVKGVFTPDPPRGSNEAANKSQQLSSKANAAAAATTTTAAATTTLTAVSEGGAVDDAVSRTPSTEESYSSSTGTSPSTLKEVQ